MSQEITYEDVRKELEYLEAIAKASVSFNEIYISSNASVKTTSALIIEGNPDRVYALFTNISTTPIYLSFSNYARVREGIPLLTKGSTYEITSINLYTGPVSAIHSGTGTKTLCVVEA